METVVTSAGKEPLHNIVAVVALNINTGKLNITTGLGNTWP